MGAHGVGRGAMVAMAAMAAVLMAAVMTIGDRVSAAPEADPAPTEVPTQYLKRLSGEEIRSALTGKRIESDPGVSSPQIFWFSEHFVVDGRFASNREGRGPPRMSGTWRLDGDRICVKAGALKVECRSLWKDTRTSAVWIRALLTGSAGPVRIIAAAVDESDPAPAELPTKYVRRLSGEEIRSLLPGKTIEPDPAVPSFQFSEHFFPDGSWSGNFQETNLLMLSGAWTMDGDRVCVRAGGKSECRSLWKDKRTNALWMKALRSGSWGPFRVIARGKDPSRGGN